MNNVAASPVHGFIESRAPKTRHVLLVANRSNGTNDNLYSSNLNFTSGHTISHVRYKQTLSNVYYEFSPSAQFLRNITKLTEFLKTKENWNGYGAQPIDTIAVLRSAVLLYKLLPHQPFVSPLTNGGVQLDWEFGEQYFELEVYRDYINVIFDENDPAQVLSDDEAIRQAKRWLNDQQ